MKKQLTFTILITLLLIGFVSSIANRTQLSQIDQGGATTNQVLGWSGTVWSPLSLTKTLVGLGNADNTSDVNKPVSTAMSSALALKADLASPTFTGTPAAPTAAANTNTTQLATTQFTTGAISTLNTTLGNQITNQGITISAIQNSSVITRVAESTFSSETALGALGTGLIINTTTTGVPVIYAGTSCTNQFPRSLNASGAATCATVALATDVSGILPSTSFPALTGDVTTSSGTVATTISANAVTNAKAAQMVNNTIKGNISGATANATDLTTAQVTGALIPCTGTAQGVVPNGGGGTTNFLRADCTWAAPSGSSGTVTSVSVSSANGFAGTVATATTTPAITLTTTATGVLKGSSGALIAATVGTDYSAGTSANATGLVLSTTSTGALSAYGGAACTNQFVRSLNASAAATCASVALGTDTSGILGVGSGGTGVSTAPTAGGVAYGLTTSSIGYSAVGTASQVLVGGATPTFVNNAPSAAQLTNTVAANIDANADRGAGVRQMIHSTSSTNFPTVAGNTIEARRASGSASDAGTFQIDAANDDGLNTCYFREVIGYTAGDTWGSWRQCFFTDSILAASQLPSVAVRNDTANTFTSAGSLNLAASPTFTVPTAAAASPTVSGQIAYDSTSNTLETGVNGVNKTFAFLDSNITGTSGGLSADIPESRVTNLVTDLATKLTATITSPATGQFVRYNGANWVNIGIQVSDVPVLNQSTTGTAANLTSMAANTILCNNTGSTAAPINCTGTQTTALLDQATTSLKGLLGATDQVKLNFAFGTQATLASATTTDLGTISSQNVLITGATTITSFGSSAITGRIYKLIFQGAPLLTQNATSLVLPGAVNIQAAAGDTASLFYNGSGNWVVIDYQRASGQSLVYAQTTCTNQFIRLIANTGLGTCQSVALGSDVTGTLLAAQFPALTGQITTTAGSLATTIASNTVSNTNLAQAPTLTMKGNNTAATSNVADLTVTQVQGMITPLLSKSTTAASAAINTTSTYISPTTFNIAANTLAVGDAFRITVNGTNTSSAAVVQTYTPRFGAAGTIADTGLTAYAVTSATTGTAIPFEIVFTCVVRAIGASGSIYCYSKHMNNGVTGSATAAANVGTGSATTINTTATSILGLSVVTAATTSTNTYQMVTVGKVR
jgi:hypothetical protein